MAWDEAVKEFSHRRRNERIFIVEGPLPNRRAHIIVASEVTLLYSESFIARRLQVALCYLFERCVTSNHSTPSSFFIAVLRAIMAETMVRQPRSVRAKQMIRKR